jgi:xeroderma pigmentosum group C-complementing protein
MPAGTVHLRFPRLAAVCRGLGADFAHAMAGFEIKGGRSVPVIDGVVVCAEDEARVMAAYHTAER